jgi:putative hemolysin
MPEHSSQPVLLDHIHSGSLGLRIAQEPWEIEAAQTLRYRVFYEEMGGAPSQAMRKRLRDFDEFDASCDHLLVLDYDLPQSIHQVVGTYRLLKRNGLPSRRFYSETEFDISRIKEEKGEILELGRSCVDPAYRKRSVIQLLLRGIAAYVTMSDIKMMFGCASFFGTDIGQHAISLSYLHHYHNAPEEIRSAALPEKYLEMNLIAKEAIDVKTAFASLPALIKGYLRMNSYVGQGAVIDPHFKTIYIGIVVKTDRISSKYVQRYSAPFEKMHCRERLSA